MLEPAQQRYRWEIFFPRLIFIIINVAFVGIPGTLPISKKKKRTPNRPKTSHKGFKMNTKRLENETRMITAMQRTAFKVLQLLTL